LKLEIELKKLITSSKNLSESKTFDAIDVGH